MNETRLSDFIKAYDVRGLVPEQLDASVARAIGAAFARVVAAPDGARGIVVGHDMRPSSPLLVAALRRSSRDTVPGSRPIVRAISRTPLSFARRIAISSRSSKVR